VLNLITSLFNYWAVEVVFEFEECTAQVAFCSVGLFLQRVKKRLAKGLINIK
jgi:hypothetical protein